MGFFTQPEMVEQFGNKAAEKAGYSFLKLFLLAIEAGAFIAMGYLFFVRVVGTLPKEWGSLSNLLGGAVFPMGLIAIVFIGGELLTGNMMVMALGFLQKKVRLSQVGYNWIVVLLGNLVGGLLVAYFFGHITGLTEGAFLDKTVAVAMAKINDPPVVAFVSGIGCNIFVCMAVWMGAAAKDGAGKFLGLWFPIMAFVAIGFQHVVANGFIIPAAIFSGASEITWANYFVNVVVVFLGNAVGGAFGIAVPAYFSYRKQAAAQKVENVPVQVTAK